MRCVILPILWFILTGRYLGSLWKCISIDSEFVWLLTSPTVQLCGVDAYHSLSRHQHQTIHHKRHVELSQRTCTDD